MQRVLAQAVATSYGAQNTSANCASPNNDVVSQYYTEIFAMYIPLVTWSHLTECSVTVTLEYIRIILKVATVFKTWKAPLQSIRILFTTSLHTLDLSTTVSNAPSFWISSVQIKSKSFREYEYDVIKYIYIHAWGEVDNELATPLKNLLLCQLHEVLDFRVKFGRTLSFMESCFVTCLLSCAKIWFHWLCTDCVAGYSWPVRGTHNHRMYGVR